MVSYQTLFDQVSEFLGWNHLFIWFLQDKLITWHCGRGWAEGIDSIIVEMTWRVLGKWFGYNKCMFEYVNNDRVKRQPQDIMI